MSVSAVHLAGSPARPLLVLGPSLGTSTETLWSTVAALLAEDFYVIGWDLPGHGVSTGSVEHDLSIAKLARSVLDLVDSAAGPDAPFDYAGNSVGGAVGLQLLLDAPERVLTATLSCTGARIATESFWADRAAAVTASGTSSLVGASAERWFASGFLDRHPERGSALLHALSDTDDTGYVAVCRALGAFDVRERLGQIHTPVLAVAGEVDQVTPAVVVAEISEGVQDGRLVLVPATAHLAPVEEPETIARLIRQHTSRHAATPPTTADVHNAGMAVRREVLGNSHVDHALAGATSFTEDFQRLITQYAWGNIWTRPGLDRRSRSMITLAALISRGHHEEFAIHLRAARTNGLSVEEIQEIILQSAIYCGVPAANTAFRIAEETLIRLDDLNGEVQA